MIRFIISFLSIIISYTIYCQTNNDSKKYELIGALQTNDHQIISYKIVFYEKENGQIEGESITDFYGENNTRSKITGKIDKTKKTISFKEVNNISTISKADQNTFCYVHVENITITLIKDKIIIQGEFVGKFKDGKSCVNGTIYLVSASVLELLNDDKLAKKKSKIDTTNLDLSNIQQLLDNNKELRSNDVLTLNWNSKKLTLIVWDSFKEDKDIVSIYLNDKLFKENLEIKEARQTFEIPLSERVSVIKIVALSEGISPPNTMNAILRDGKLNYPVITQLKKGQSVKIELKKQ